MSPRPEIQLAEDQKRVLRLLRGQMSRSRIEISRLLDINNGVVTRLSRELISLGLVAEAEAQSAMRGRPSLPLYLRAEGAYAIGAATHPGWVDICILDFAGTPIAQRSCRWDDVEPERFAALLASEVDAMTASLRLRQSRFLGFGISVPGFMIGSSAQRHTVERMQSWRDQDLATLLGDVLDGPVWIENDANASAIAEYYQLDKPDAATMLVLFLGHGVGAGCIAGGQLFVGEYGNAGEIGILYPLDQPRPSAIDLALALGKAAGEDIDVSDIELHLDRHIEILDLWVERAARQLELAVLSGIGWFDPAAIVLSGSLPSRVLDLLVDRLNLIPWVERLGGRSIAMIRASRLQGRAAAIGAAFLPIHHMAAPQRNAIGR